MHLNKFGILVFAAFFAVACDDGGGETDDTTVDDTDDTTVDDTNVDDTNTLPDTGIELWGLKGTATVDTTANTWSGTHTMYDEVYVNAAQNYTVGDSLCEVDYTVTQNATTPAPTLACTGCSFGFLLDYSAPTATRQEATYCDDWYTGSSIITDAPMWEDVGLGYHPSYGSTSPGPAVMTYFPAYGSYAAEWSGSTYGSADFTSGTFTFDWPISLYYY